MPKRKYTATTPEKKVQIMIPIRLLKTIREKTEWEGIRSEREIILQALLFYRTLVNNIGKPLVMRDCRLAEFPIIEMAK